jgi:hypothetical protein
VTDLPEAGYYASQGGRISGRFNLRVLKRVVLNATSTVELRNGARLVNAGSFWWASGNMSLAEGAMIQVRPTPSGWA